jgi:putative flippase GtrA
MTTGPSRIIAAVKSRLQTPVGKRFRRFVLVAAAAVVTSQVTLTICLGPGDLTAGKSAVAAWVAGAAVSYVLSRWAFEARGRPNLLKETLPFWIVAVGTAVVLTLTTKWANHQATSMGLNDTQQVLFDDAAYFVANCLTFLTRFVIFHYVLFKDRGSRASELVSELPAAELPGAAEASVGAEPLATAGSAGRGANGSGLWAPGERSPGRRASRDESALPEPGARR